MDPQIITSIDFTEIRPYLQSLYSPDNRGRKPRDPVKMLRSLTLMISEGVRSIPKWVEATRSNPRYAELIGFNMDDMPGVGTYYDFYDRLIDGPYKKECEHFVRPSKLEKKSKVRNLKREKDERKVEDDGRRKTGKLSQELIDASDLPNPEDLQSRMQALFFKVAVRKSIERNLIDARHLIVSGDGSCIESGASPYGKPLCDCRLKGNYKCECDRLYSDRTANWGWDSYRECFFFGYRCYQIVNSTSGHDLPLAIMVEPANSTDFTMSLKTFDRFIKFSADIGMNLDTAVLDAGHDAMGIYDYFDAKGISPCISLNPRTSSNPSKKDLSPNGIPLCPAGLEMRFNSRDPKQKRQLYNCPVKRPTHRNGRYFFISHVDECPYKRLCQPDTSMGPVVTVYERENLRMHPIIRRNSKKYSELMNLRTGVERSNSMKKYVYQIEQRHHRRESLVLIDLYLISIIEHATAWAIEDKKRAGVLQVA